MGKALSSRNKMVVIDEILRIKAINSNQKLVLGYVYNECTLPMSVECLFTTQEIANVVGMSYKDVASTLWDLDELSLINTTVENRIRTTKITSLLKRIIKNNK